MKSRTNVEKKPLIKDKPSKKPLIKDDPNPKKKEIITGKKLKELFPMFPSKVKYAIRVYDFVLGTTTKKGMKRLEEAFSRNILAN